MPQEQQNQRAKPAANQPGLLRRIFGSGELSPEVLQAIEIAKREMPDLAPVQPYGLLSRMYGSDAQAYTSPGRNIYMNPAQMQGQSVQDIADILTHEQEHVKQMKERGHSSVGEFLRQAFTGQGPYHQRTDEMSAFQAEKDRRARMGRGGTTATPSFLTGEYNVPQDINLPNPNQNLRRR